MDETPAAGADPTGARVITRPAAGRPGQDQRPVMLIRSPLFWKACAWMGLGLLLWLPFFYWMTVPLVNRLIFDIEERASRAQLDTVYQFVSQADDDLETWRQSAIDAHKRELRSVVSVAGSYVSHGLARVARGEATVANAQQDVLLSMRALRYGNDDYLWIANDESVLISHPDPAFFRRDMAKVKDVRGNLVVPPMVEGARQHGEGYYSYWWYRLGSGEAEEKLSYYRYIPQWRWTISTGIYISDVNREVERRKAATIDSLRQHLRTTPIANGGYVFVFDGKSNMIIHPDPAIEGHNVSDRLDPATGKRLYAELMAAARTEHRELTYTWNRQNDRDHYIHRKIAWVRYFAEYDWYLVASAYVDDLSRSGRHVTQRILLAFALGLLITAGIGFVFVRNLTVPILRLTESARRNSEGDFSASASIDRNDEIGILAQAFNRMVLQVRSHIDNLERRVRDRTSEISNWAGQLQARNREIAIVDGAVQSFQACETQAEVADILGKALAALFPGMHSAILSLPASGADGAAGSTPAPDNLLGSATDCWALRRGQVHRVDANSPGAMCRHVAPGCAGPYMCVPLSVRGTLFGILHLAPAPGQTAPVWDAERLEPLARTMADQVSLTLANLTMRQTLQEQSIHDPLTRLYNRRYLYDWAHREEQRARRNQASLGVIMLDIDHFKRVNDTYGHEAGDIVLKNVAKVLSEAVRGGDIACRFGGEEFLLVLPDADLPACVARAEQLRRSVEAAAASWRGQPVKVTVSLGVAIFPMAGDSVDAVIAAADGAMYRAKNAGRNRVENAGPAATAPQTENGNH